MLKTSATEAAMSLVSVSLEYHSNCAAGRLWRIATEEHVIADYYIRTKRKTWREEEEES